MNESICLNIFCKKKCIRREKVLALEREKKYIAMQIGNCTVSQLALIKLQFSEDHGSLMFMNVSRVFLDPPASSERQPL